MRSFTRSKPHHSYLQPLERCNPIIISYVNILTIPKRNETMDPRVQIKLPFGSHNAAHVTDSRDLDVYIDNGTSITL